TFLPRAPGLVAATLAIVLVGKPLAALVIALALGRPLRVALAVAVALAQVGEFSFILATLGTQLGALPAEAMQAGVAAALVSISTHPLLYRLVGPVARRLGRAAAAPATAADAAAMRPPEVDPSHRAVVVGYGPVGRTLVRLLRENGVEPTVVEMGLPAIG